MSTITVGTLENGTLNWELQTIRDRGSDRENGFELRMQPLRAACAMQVGMQGAGRCDRARSDPGTPLLGHILRDG